MVKMVVKVVVKVVVEVVDVAFRSLFAAPWQFKGRLSSGMEREGQRP